MDHISEIVDFPDSNNLPYNLLWGIAVLLEQAIIVSIRYGFKSKESTSRVDPKYDFSSPVLVHRPVSVYILYFFSFTHIWHFMACFKFYDICHHFDEILSVTTLEDVCLATSGCLFVSYSSIYILPLWLCIVYKIVSHRTTLQWHSTWSYAGLILGLHPANERRCYFVTTSLIGWM